MSDFKRLCLGCLLLVWATWVFAAEPAEAWPVRPIKVIVPAPAGGPYDRVIRPLAQQMAMRLKQPLVIDNRASAGNIVGTQAGAHALPDGYTLTMTGMLNTIAQSLYDRLSFQIVRDFEHIGAIGGGAQWLVTRSDTPVKSLDDLVARARAQPGKLEYASSGPGSTGHLLMTQFQREAGIELMHVPYKGGAPALQEVFAGVVPLIVIPPNVAVGGVRDGRLKVLATSSSERGALFPDIPTFAELGYPTLVMMAWVGLSAPKGTPEPIVRKLNEVLLASLQEPSLISQLELEGLVSMPMSPQQYTELVRSETDRWGRLVRSLKLKAN